MFAIMIEDINEHIKKQIQPELDPKEVLLVEFREFADVFSKEVSDTLPEHREEYDHKIELEAGAELPRTQPLRRMSPDELKVVKKYIKEHLEKRFIEPSTALFASPILLVQKP
ncbi:hypothetical protein EPUS_09129 [Endocarpon pusillum Z07020]|uniref:Uncharacterized protein n=1 Tax=Endocarpon pusillum (strain Z07020 / HMAS-L-300199) TaxID=1263415 RepID=U1GMM5_ENDPU|nr:uncharacterized protein EPUS_09129 [Endocarpon pusillum Z07020]ERF73131.1 hypothetical protein EPUS_09129 [Endocarpon pusillum Z07020]